MKSFRNLGIGKDLPCFVICEIGQAHDGSLGLAHSMIDAAAVAGANAVKFQTHIAAEESTYDEQFRVVFSFQDRTRYDYWKRMEFTQYQWGELAKHAQERGLLFMSSPFSAAAVDILQAIGINVWKLGSGELSNNFLIERILASKLPVIASTGLHSWVEIDSLAKKFIGTGTEFALLQCTSSYPSKLEEAGLNILEEFEARFGCITGLSDHSGRLSPSLYAIARGAQIVEVHCTFDRRMFGPDASSSLTFDELQQLVRLRDEFFVLRTHPVDKDQSALFRADTRTLFARSVALKRDMSKGDILKPDDMTLKKPGGGFHESTIKDLVGRKLKHDVSSQRLLQEDDLEP
jgi:N,N'-diacetyllegionaminate synthase